MKKIELYDIITLKDKTEYTVLKMLNDEGNLYYLLAPIDEDEEPDMELIKIVKVTEKEEKTLISENIPEEKKQKLAKLFLASFREGLD